MVTKKTAMQIYNLYSQIEKSNEMINVLSKCKDEYEKDNDGILLFIQQSRKKKRLQDNAEQK